MWCARIGGKPHEGADPGNQFDAHRCGPKDWASETNRLLHEDRIKTLVREEVAVALSKTGTA